METYAKLGDFERAVLFAVWRLANNAYGTTILKEVEMAHDRSVAIGALYTTLDRLGTKGLVSSAKGESTPERGGRAKRFFVLTAPGELALRASLARIRRLEAALSPIVDGI